MEQLFKIAFEKTFKDKVVSYETKNCLTKKNNIKNSLFIRKADIFLANKNFMAQSTVMANIKGNMYVT